MDPTPRTRAKRELGVNRPRRLLRLVATGVAATALGAALVLACGGPNSHVLSGRRYLADRDCVEALSSVDVVEGPDPGRTCAPICIVGQSPLLVGPAVYVTTQCPPYPPTFDLSGENPECAGALAALERLDICNAEGSTNPRDGGDVDASEPDAGEPDAAPIEDAGDPPRDAGEDASDVTDAGEDAGDPLDASEPRDASDAD